VTRVLGRGCRLRTSPRNLTLLSVFDISEPTARRHGQAAGAAYVAFQTSEADAIQGEDAATTPGPDLQQVSVDGAMIPLVHKEWGEVRTVAIVRVEKPVMEKGEPVVHTRDVSYFSRLCDAETFSGSGAGRDTSAGDRNSQERSVVLWTGQSGAELSGHAPPGCRPQSSTSLMRRGIWPARLRPRMAKGHQTR